MQAYQAYYYGNPGGDHDTGASHSGHGTGRYSGYSPSTQPDTATQAQAQSHGSAQTGSGGVSQIDYGLSPEAQRIVTEEHFNNAILITLLVTGALFFVYLWFYLSPLFRNPTKRTTRNKRSVGLIAPFTCGKPRKAARGMILSHKEGDTKSRRGPYGSFASWKTFRPWSEEWSRGTHSSGGKPPPSYTPRPSVNYPFALAANPNMTSNSTHQPALLSVSRKITQTVSIARESTATVPKRLSHFLHRSFGSGTGAVGTSSSNYSGYLNITSASVNSDDLRNAPSTNTTTTTLRPCIASRSVSDQGILQPPAIYIPKPSRTSVHERYSAFYGDGELSALSNKAPGKKDDTRTGSRVSRAPSLLSIRDHSQMGIAF